jgi:hypothetical protein
VVHNKQHAQVRGLSLDSASKQLDPAQPLAGGATQIHTAGCLLLQSLLMERFVAPVRCSGKTCCTAGQLKRAVYSLQYSLLPVEVQYSQQQWKLDAGVANVRANVYYDIACQQKPA